ncbi:MAG: phosphoesterase [Armatimonadetes bacterium]|nr:phosphoesterase [Armatimonadota bacterium]
MIATHRLYHDDARLLEFEATVTRASPAEGGRTNVVLDATAFYPTSGGQPHDRGRLGGLPVVDVLDGDEIVHVVEGDGGGWAGRRVRGEIDRDRRTDLTQQHSGQHVLSAACLQVCGAATLSVHIGERCTLDLDLASLDEDQAAAIEALANRIVLENRTIDARVVSSDEATSLGLRRPPKRDGDLRVVTIDQFDVSACAGTHAARTGEIGPIKLLRWERRRGGLRIEFCCGRRALADYAAKHALVARWSQTLSVSDRELDAALTRLRQRAEESGREAEASRSRLIALEADRWLASASDGIVAHQEGGRDAGALLAAARHIQAEGATALLGSDGHLVFARAADAAGDMAALLRRACEALGGRGGGNATFAQGSVPSEVTAAAIARARVWLVETTANA